MSLTGESSKRAVVLAVIVIGLCVNGPPIFGQLAEADFFKLLSQSGVTPDELNALKGGETIAKTVDTTVKQEIASLGVVRIRDLGPVSMLVFRESFDPKRGSELSSGGRFSVPPTPDDLRGLELSKNDVDQLIKCTVGNCDLNMPAEFIKRAGSVAGHADAPAAARQLVVEMLIGHLRSYLERGDSGLGHYENRRKPVDLTASQRALLGDMHFINELVPDLARFLRDFPNAYVPNVESTMHWSVVDFGLKPSITLSHSAACTLPQGASEQHFVVSKQIYSSRYLDSSLTLTSLLRVSSGDAVDTYLILADRSRSDALEGPLGGLARRAVEKESSKRITAVLDKAHLRLLAAARSGKSPAVAESDEPSILRSLTSRKALYLTVLIAIAAGIGFFFWRRALR